MKAETEQQSSRGEKQDMTSDDYEQGRVRDETAQGRRDGNQMDTRQESCRAGGSEGGWRDKGSGMKGTGRQFEISRSSGEKSHLYSRDGCKDTEW